MPIDPFAALNAIVRAEATRTLSPTTPPPAESTEQPDEPSPLEPTPVRPLH
ncbi:hypothetical protein [Streptomyces sp. NPDC046887]|uniref:hypothetical protein n=1 Tax=Streptomyces sp. NPDC046887 TaxID=3155472 RepID=UPI0033F6A4C4